ncbi:uncharacterized protein [Heptranchias perlo]|uniref:uncharacterized protein isoform X2 n=1 Tax=Heptranchias perlo TaxID=212740 RepID=UPI00355994DC
MDEVWIVSLCLSFLVIVITVLSLRKSDGKSESSAKGKERTPEPVSSLPQVAARYMELTLEDIEKSLERLGAVLGTEPPGAKGAASWQHAPGSESDTQASLSGSEEQQQYQRGRRVAAPRGWAEHSGDETWNFPQRQDKIEPSEEVDLRRHGGGEGREVLEHPPATSATQNIMEQIEQAVQETLDHNRERSEFIRVRRAPPAPRDDVLQPRSSHSSD